MIGSPKDNRYWDIFSFLNNLNLYIIFKNPENILEVPRNLTPKLECSDDLIFAAHEVARLNSVMLLWKRGPRPPLIEDLGAAFLLTALLTSWQNGRTAPFLQVVYCTQNIYVCMYCKKLVFLSFIDKRTTTSNQTQAAGSAALKIIFSYY